jgi:hypothetical protein
VATGALIQVREVRFSPGVPLPAAVATCPSLTYSIGVYTFIETPTFAADADRLWDEDERFEFFEWLSVDPDSGDVVRGSGGCRKVRWSRAGMGKRGGVRVVYFFESEPGEIWLLLVYPKSEEDSIPGHLLKAIREEIEHGRSSQVKRKRR